MERNTNLVVYLRQTIDPVGNTIQRLVFMYFHQTLVHAVCQFAHTKLNQLEYFSSCPTAQLSATRLADYLRIGTLSNDDDDGIENITKKMNLRPFKLYRVYLHALNSSNVGDFSWG